MNEGSQLNKEAGVSNERGVPAEQRVSNEQGVSAEQGSQMNIGSSAERLELTITDTISEETYLVKTRADDSFHQLGRHIWCLPVLAITFLKEVQILKQSEIK